MICSLNIKRCNAEADLHQRGQESIPAEQEAPHTLVWSSLHPGADTQRRRPRMMTWIGNVLFVQWVLANPSRTLLWQTICLWIKAKILHCESVAQHQAERRRWLVETTWKEAATSKSSGWKVWALDKLFLTGCVRSCSVWPVVFGYNHWGDSTQSHWTQHRRKKVNTM